MAIVIVAKLEAIASFITAKVTINIEIMINYSFRISLKICRGMTLIKIVKTLNENL